MQLVVSLFAFLLVSKDLMLMPAPYAVRGLTQLVALALGVYWLARSDDVRLLRSLLPVWAYLLVLLASAAMSPYPLFAGLQAASLGACVFFFAGLASESSASKKDGALILSRAAILAYAFTCGASLLLLFAAPSQAFESLYGGDTLGEIQRFRGAMSKSSMIACAGGLLFGLCITTPGWGRLRLIAGTLGLTCLYLAQARTMWAALVLALLAVLWVYQSAWRKWLLGVSVSALAVIAVLPERTLQVDIPTGAQSVVRTEGIESLSGRVGLWRAGVSAIADSPLLGYGLTLGALGLPTRMPTDARSDASLHELTSVSRETLHNGFLQSFLDTGFIGALVYLGIVVLAPIRLLLHDSARRYSHVLFVLVFMAVANLGETVIYSGAVFDGVLYWGMVVFALAIGHSANTRARRRRSPPSNLLQGP